MFYCTIEKCLEYNQYILRVNKRKILMTLEFYGVEKPTEGDSFAMHKQLFDMRSPNFVQPYAWGKTEDYPENPEDLNEEFALLKTKDNKIHVLKRLYG